MGIIIGLLVIIILIMLFGREGFFGMVEGIFKFVGILILLGVALVILILVVG